MSYDTCGPIEERYLIADIMLKLGFKLIAKQILNSDRSLLNEYKNLVILEAKKRNDNIMLERLEFGGLIYG